MPSFPALRRLSSDFRTRLSLHKSQQPQAMIVINPVVDTALGQRAHQEQPPPAYEDLDLPDLVYTDSHATPSQDNDSIDTDDLHPPSYWDVNERPRQRTRPNNGVSPTSRNRRAESPQSAPQRTSGSVEEEGSNSGSSIGNIPSRINSSGEQVESSDQTEALERQSKLRLNALLALVPVEVWDRIATYCSPSTAASMAMTNRAMASRIGRYYWKMLDQPEYLQEKIKFMTHMDGKLPDHVLCYSCGSYHARTRSNEQLSATLRTKPPVNCPWIGHRRPAPRLRLTYDRILPYSLVQLAMRQYHHSSSHGIELKALSKRWQDPWSEWDHQTKFQVLNGHLFMRVKSTVQVRAGMTKAEKRLALLDRTDYAPYFSTCQHWASESTLTSLCKCALSHIPVGNGPRIAGSCDACRPLRRCYHCPTEYHIKVSLKEVKDDLGKPAFRHSLCVTRWSDLGDGRNPWENREWLACNDLGEYEPMQRHGDLDGARTLRRRFENNLGTRVPEARALPLRKKEAWQSTNVQLWTDEQRWMAEQSATEGQQTKVLGGGQRFPGHFL